MGEKNIPDSEEDRKITDSAPGILEKNWGLFLVSFLPNDAVDQILGVQKKIAALCNETQTPSVRDARRFIEFTEPKSLHCTHYFFKAWKKDGPILQQELVKPGYTISILFTEIRDILPKSAAQTVEIHAGLSLGSVVASEGMAVGESVDVRRKLISSLNKHIPDALEIRSMPWYTDPEKFHEVHVTFGLDQTTAATRNRVISRTSQRP